MVILRLTNLLPCVRRFSSSRVLALTKRDSPLPHKTCASSLRTQMESTFGSRPAGQACNLATTMWRSFARCVSRRRAPSQSLTSSLLQTPLIGCIALELAQIRYSHIIFQYSYRPGPSAVGPQPSVYFRHDRKAINLYAEIPSEGRQDVRLRY